MAFKMKGSPHKMGGIKGALAHASALKQIIGGGENKWRDQYADQYAQMSYTDEAVEEARKNIENLENLKSTGQFNLKTDVDNKNVEGQLNYSDLQEEIEKNKDVIRAHRHQTTGKDEEGRDLF
tara:strand:+ start:134 stop:502 length:369 start_codon:yes stop_codon:yes gene_type:complete